jgi:uncharacterized DUF497 family protein
VVDWHRFIPSDFEYDFDRDKLVAHGVTFEEAVECFFSDFSVRRNKRYRTRYQLVGRTLSGRRLKIILCLLTRICGWIPVAGTCKCGEHDGCSRRGGGVL